MPRGETLSSIRTLYKALTRTSQNSNNTLADAETDALLAAHQLEIAGAYNWPFLNDRWSLVVPAGTRYIALPTTNLRSIASVINTEQSLKVFVSDAGADFCELAYGIGFEQYNQVNSIASQTNSQIQRWQIDTNTSEAAPNEIEVWPIPSVERTLYFEGRRMLSAFAASTDKSDLDGLLIALHAAADTAKLRSYENADSLLKRAKDRLFSCLNRQPVDETRMLRGQESSSEQTQQRLVRVGIA